MSDTAKVAKNPGLRRAGTKRGKPSIIILIRTHSNKITSKDKTAMPIDLHLAQPTSKKIPIKNENQ